MKKILFFLDELYHKNDGRYISKYNAGRFLLELVDNHKLTFIVPISTIKIEQFTTELPGGVDVIELNEWNSLAGYIRDYLKNTRELKRKGKDVINGQDVIFIRLPSIPGIMIIKEARKYNKKIIVHIAGDIRDSYKTGKYKGISKYIANFIGKIMHYNTIKELKKCKDIAVLCTGSKLMNEYRQFNPKFFIDNEFEVEEKSECKDKIEFIYVGRLIESKGIKYLVDAWKNIDYTLHIVGTGELDGYIKEESKRNPNICFHGFKNGNQLEDIYMTSSCLIVPSIGTEGFPRVIAEAWCKGLIVIGTNVGGIDGIAKEGESILYIPEKNSEAIVEKVNQITSNKELYIYLRSNSLDIANKLSKTSMLDIIEEILDD